MSKFLLLTLLILSTNAFSLLNQHYCVRGQYIGISKLFVKPVSGLMDLDLGYITQVDTNDLISLNEVTNSSGQQEITAVFQIDNIGTYPFGANYLEGVIQATENIASQRLEGTLSLRPAGTLTPFIHITFVADANTPYLSDCGRAKMVGNLPNAPFYRKLKTNVITNTSNIVRLSKFRSGYGHSYPDDFGKCIAKKHYFEMDINSSTDIRLPRFPIQGHLNQWVLWNTSKEVGADDVEIIFQSLDYPELFLKFAHLEPNSMFDFMNPALIGSTFGAGTILGTTRDPANSQTDFDLSAEILRAKQGGKVQIYSIFNLYANSTLNNSYPSIMAHPSKREWVINPSGYNWNPSIFPARKRMCRGEYAYTPTSPMVLPDDFLASISYLRWKHSMPNAVCSDFNLNVSNDDPTMCVTELALTHPEASVTL